MRAGAAVLAVCGLGVAVLPGCAPWATLPPEHPPPPRAAVPPVPPAERPPAPAQIPTAPPTPPPSLRYRERERQALGLLQAGDLAQALTAWKVLQVLDPENPEYPRQIGATRALIRQRAEYHLRAGDAAFAAGNREQAQLAYLRALALDPWDTQPLERLRAMDRERALAAQEERLGRSSGGRRAGGKKAEGGRAEGASSPGPQERDYRETGIALFRQRQYEDSVLELQKYLRSFPGDAEARRYLEEARRRLAAPSGSSPAGSAAAPTAPPPVAPAPPAGPAEPRATPGNDGQAAGKNRALAQGFYEKGLRASRTDVDQAIEQFEQALRHDPDHVPARLQLDRARRMRRALEQIPGE